MCQSSSAIATYRYLGMFVRVGHILLPNVLPPTILSPTVLSSNTLSPKSNVLPLAHG